MAENQQLHVNVFHEEDHIWATVDEFPGVFATGDDYDELRESMTEGIALVLERTDGERPTVSIVPWDIEPTESKASAELVCA
jgi:predicted RNase H-like HicB family nuclease